MIISLANYWHAMVYIHGDIKAALRSSLFDLSWGSVVPVFQSQLRSVLQCIFDYVVLTCPLLLSGLSCLSYFVFLQKISVPCSSSNTSCKFQVMHSLPDVTSGVQMRSSSSACWIKAVSPLHLFFLCIFSKRLFHGIFGYFSSFLWDDGMANGCQKHL